MAGSMTDDEWELAESSIEVYNGDEWESADSSSNKEGVKKSDDEKDEVEFLEVISKHEISNIEENIHRSNEEHLKAMTGMVDQFLQQQLANEQAAQTKYRDEINKLNESLDKAKNDTEEIRKLSGSGLRANQDEISKLKKNIDMLKEEQLQSITEMVERRWKETTVWLEKQLADQRATSSKSNQLLQAALSKSGSEIFKIKEILVINGEEVRKEISKIKDSVDQSNREQRAVTTEVLNLKRTALVHGKQLGKEQASQTKYNDEISKLMESLEKVKKDIEEVRKLTESGLYMTQDEIIKLEENFDASKKDQLQAITEMVEQGRKETTLWLEKQLAGEQAMRLKANQLLQEAMTKYENEMYKICGILEKDREEVRKLSEGGVHANRDEMAKIQKSMDLSNEEQCKAVTEVQEKLKEAMLWLMEELAGYKAAQSTSETKFNEEISKLKLSLDEVGKDTKEVRELAESSLHAYKAVQKIEQQLAEEQTTRINAVGLLFESQTKSNDEISSLSEDISKLKLNLEKTGKTIKEVQELAENGVSGNGVTAKVVKQMVEEQIKSLEAEELLREAHYNEIRNLKESLGETMKNTEEVRKLAENGLRANEVELWKIEDNIYSSIAEMVEKNLKVAMSPLEEQLKEERAARLKLEESLQETQEKSSDEVIELKKSLEKAKRETEELRSHRGKLSTCELQRKTKSLLKEYFSVRLLDEALQCVEELNAPEYHSEFVKQTFAIGLEESPAMVEPVAELLGYLFVKQVLTARDIVTGCQLFGAMLDDFSLDVPTAPSDFGGMLGKLVLVGCLDLKRVKKVLEKNVDDFICRTAIYECTKRSIKTSPSGKAILAAEKADIQAESGSGKESSPERRHRKYKGEVVSHSTMEDASDRHYPLGRLPSLLLARRPHRCMLFSTFKF